MDVVVGHRRHVEVDDVAERFHVDPAGRDVGGHEEPEAAALEAFEGGGALRLAPVAVDALAVDAVAGEEIGEAIGAVLGAGEDEGVLHLVALDQLEEQ